MTAEIIKIDSAHPEHAFSRCRDIVRAGGVIAYPTDTFYGLGADPENPVAVKRIFAIKGRQADQPILLLISEPSEVRNWTGDVSPQAEKLIRRFWPGPLTLVFKSAARVIPELSKGTGTIGLRVPGNSVTRGMLVHIGTALTGTSANRSGRPSPETAAEAMEAVGSLVDLIVDAGRTAGGKPSTVVDVSAAEPRVIREGAISARDVLG